VQGAGDTSSPSMSHGLAFSYGLRSKKKSVLQCCDLISMRGRGFPHGRLADKSSGVRSGTSVAMPPKDMCTIRLAALNLYSGKRRHRVGAYAGGSIPLVFGLFISQLCCPCALKAQGGPPYYTNDPGTPGNRNWEINLGYMPFFCTGHSTSHIPDVDINYGLGDRIQLTYENAWLRDRKGNDAAKYGLGQDQLGVKWRFYENKEAGFEISAFPQLSINNPNHAVERGITPPGASLILPVEFRKTLGRIDVNWEVGYNAVHLGKDGWIAGLVVGTELSKKLELDAEFYGLGNFNNSENRQTLGAGARYKLRPPFILLLMAGRSVAPAHNDQPFFVGYFGVQFLLPPKPFD
jgi:hypothetical protein